MTEHHHGQPFDEKAALAELERLRDAIQAARQGRIRKSEEFDRFVQGFRKPPSAPTREPAAAVPTPSPQPVQQTPGPANSDNAPASGSAPAPIVETSPAFVVPPSAAPAAMPTATGSHVSRIRRPARSGTVLASALIAVVGVIGAGVLLNRSVRHASPPAANSSVSSQPSGVQVKTATPAPAPPATALPAPAPAAIVVELNVIRPVWMRVTVDGQKKQEGMVREAERIRLTGDHVIVVRVGNGADVAVKTGTRDEPFGAAGQPVTRTFLRRDVENSANR